MFVGALGLSWLGARRQPWALASRGARVRFGLYLAAAAALAAAGVHAWLGRGAPDAPAIALDFPLRDARFYVASGGRNVLVNTHLDATPAFRAHSFALDIVAVDRLGQRADGLLPEDPEAYTVFGLPVYAPCDGTVRRVVDGLPDQRPPALDRGNVAGNHVVLACGAAEVMLAHLRRGSVEVREGDTVKRGDRLAAVGNSGYSGEPHLHVHAQRAGPGGDGEPLAMTFGGRTLSRGLVPPSR
jgi:hypothetical protein